MALLKQLSYISAFPIIRTIQLGHSNWELQLISQVYTLNPSNLSNAAIQFKCAAPKIMDSKQKIAGWYHLVPALLCLETQFSVQVMTCSPVRAGKLKKNQTT